MTLHIAPGLELADDFVTKTVGILAQRRKGKTYTANVIAEELVVASIPFVALDPTSAWWGLRASADGSKEGLPVTILGGEHGDVPLSRGDGKAIAELVVDEPGYYVIDFGLFESGAAEKQFATDFAQRLYRRKGQPGSDFPLHLFIDEADRFVPQRIMDRKEGDAAMLGAFEVIVRRGGLRGLGTTLISQRAAVVNKNVLEQLDTLVILRVVGPNDQKAIRAYVENNGTAEQVKELMGSLASLEVGEAWFWEPGEGTFARVRVRERRTFNSSATPKPGERRVEPRRLAAVDLEAIKDRLSANIEKAKADDPRELHRRIRELERELQTASKGGGLEPPMPVVERVEVPVLDAAALENLRAMVVALDARFTAAVETCIAAFRDDLDTELVAGVERIIGGQRDRQDVPRAGQSSGGTRPRDVAARQPAQRPDPPARRQSRGAAVPRPTGSTIGGGAPRRLLIALAQFGPTLNQSRAAALVGITQRKSTMRNALSSLRGPGLIEGSDPITITEAGLAELGTDYEPLPTGRELIDFWRGELGDGAPRKIFDEMVDAYPTVEPLEVIAERCGIDPGTSTLRNAMSRLRVLGLIQGNMLDDDFCEAAL